MDGAEAGVSSGPERTGPYVRTRTRPGNRARREGCGPPARYRSGPPVSI